MGRPPCCDKFGVKKGPWTPEEDIILVSYIQEHGPGNWRTVPTNTGLPRCSKSCRLRWTNYLKPGIKRGNFTDHEEKMIIHLQELLGNRWAAIASYIPQRTDNDIKNYWNTHLKKKLRKLQTGLEDESKDGFSSTRSSSSITKGQWEMRLQTDIHMAKKALCDALSMVDQKPTCLPELKPSNGYFPDTNQTQATTTYASSTENISRLLEGWMRTSPKPGQATSETTWSSITNTLLTDSSCSEGTPSATNHNDTMSLPQPPKTFESIFALDSSANDVSPSMSIDESTNLASDTSMFQDESKPKVESQVPFSVLEKWLFEENAFQSPELLGISLDDTAELF